MLYDLLHSIWDELSIPIEAGAHPFRLLQLATLGVDGCPRSRSIILREADATAGTLVFWIDRRSNKFQELLRNPFVALSAFDGLRNVQLRLEGRASVQFDPQRKREIWNVLKPQSKQLFSRFCPPGTVLDDPAEAWREEPETDSDEHFCIVTVNVDRVEWLDLADTGHQRARFSRLARGWRKEWLAP